MEPIEELKHLAREDQRRKHPNFTYPPPVTYRDNTANGLTKCIIDYIRFTGGQAERISCTGRRIDRRKVVTDCLGHRRQIGTLHWIPASMQRGTADISATVNGRSIKIEVKSSASDRQSERQREYQRQIEAAGGLYYLAETFAGFYAWLNGYLLKTEGQPLKEPTP